MTAQKTTHYIQFYAGLPCGHLSFTSLEAAEKALDAITFNGWKAWYSARLAKKQIKNREAIMNMKTSVTATLTETLTGNVVAKRSLS